MTEFTTLIDAKTLVGHLILARKEPNGADPWVIFDCRARLGDPSWGAIAFEAGHIPGAVHLDLDRHLAAEPGSRGRHPLPEREDLAEQLRSAGLANNAQAIVYDDANGAFAARAWWCLRWLGHRPVALLDGGLNAFTQASGEPLQTGPVAAHARGNFSCKAPLTRTIDPDAILRSIQAQSADLTLLDARAQARFDGMEEPIDPVAGHIPGARCHPFTENLTAAGLFKDPVALRQGFDDLSANVVCYCGSGVTAAHNVLAMVHAGLPEPALYPGSWSEWITDPQRPRAP